MVVYLLKNITQFIFMRLRHKNPFPLVFDTILSIIYWAFLIWNIVLLVYYYSRFDIDQELYYISTVSFMLNNGREFGIQIWFSILLAVHSTRALFLLLVSKTFGPMVEIIINMLREVLKFAVILMSIIFIFIGSMRLLWVPIPQFKDNTQSFLTLFSASLSSFSFSIFEENMAVNKWYGYVSMMIFLLISAVTLLNFLIGIISNVYNTLSEISIGLYLKSMIMTRQTLQDHPKYSSLVSCVPPFNFFIFPLTPFVVWCQSKRLNSALLQYSYIWVMILGLLVYTFLSILWIPIAYFVIIINLFKTIWGIKTNKRPTWIAIVDIFLFLIFGLGILFFKSILDATKFIIDLYNPRLIMKHVEMKWFENVAGEFSAPIDEWIYKLFLLFLERYPHSIPAKTLIKDLSEALDIEDCLKDLIFQTPVTSTFKFNKQ